MKYGIALKEKVFTDGLTRKDVVDLFDMLNNKEAYPIEFEARERECSAMGFITREVAELFDYDYESSGLRDFIAVVLDNKSDESEVCKYEFKGVSIWLS